MKVFYYRLLCLAALCGLDCAYSILLAQFLDVTAEHGIYIYNDNSVWENGVSFHDFDRDGLDDLTYTSNHNGVFTFRNTGSSFEQVYYLVSIPGRIISPTWVDFDNDGDADFFATRAFDHPVLWRNNGDMTFEDISSFMLGPMAGVISTTATWGDYDNDGYLDVYVGNYNLNLESGTHNWLFHNLGNGSFEEVSASVGLTDGNGKSYQCIFLDADFDLDQDLLVVHDKYIGCRFFENQGGWFEDVGPQNGFDVSLNAMSLSVSDFDHDGDYDYYISNTVEGNFFLVNENGLYSNQAENLNAQVNASCWGAMFIDSKNSTYEDLYVVSTGPSTGMNVLMQNSQGAYFLSSYVEFGNADDEFMWTVAKGDFNNDGAYDVMSLPYQSNGSALFESSGNNANWIKIGLNGTVSNRDGIGSTVRCFVEDEEFIRPLTCGENFQSQDSGYLIFGLQDFSSVDSLIIEWPSGLKDVHYNLGVNQFHSFLEGETMSTPDMASEYFICPEDSVELTANELNFQFWDNGSTNLSIVVHEPGVYTALHTTPWGADYEHTFFVEQHPIPQWSSSVLMPSCHGYDNGQAELLVDNAFIDSIYWFDGTNEFLHENLVSGVYWVNLITVNSCMIPIEITIPEQDSILQLNELNQINCHGTFVTPNPAFIGGYPPYEIDWGELNPTQIPPGIHVFDVADSQGCAAEFSFEVQWLPEIIMSLEFNDVCPGETTSIDYSASGGTGNLHFDFDEVDPLNVGIGSYQIFVFDDAFCFTVQTIDIAQFDVMQNTATITNAQNGANGAIEINTSGGLAPYDYAWSNGESESIITGLSQGEYTCIVTDANGCSEALVVPVVDLIVEENVFDAIIFPQPFCNDFSIKVPGQHAFEIFDITGKIIMNGSFVEALQINSTIWPSGFYILQLDNRISQKLCKE
jgi:hypothetical protein